MKVCVGSGRVRIKVGSVGIDTVEFLICNVHMFDLCKVGNYFVLPTEDKTLHIGMYSFAEMNIITDVNIHDIDIQIDDIGPAEDGIVNLIAGPPCEFKSSRGLSLVNRSTPYILKHRINANSNVHTCTTETYATLLCCLHTLAFHDIVENLLTYGPIGASYGQYYPTSVVKHIRRRAYIFDGKQIHTSFVYDEPRYEMDSGYHLDIWFEFKQYINPLPLSAFRPQFKLEETRYHKRRLRESIKKLKEHLPEKMYMALDAEGFFFNKRSPMFRPDDYILLEINEYTNT